MSERISYWLWRIERLLCLFRHQWVNDYTRISNEGHYSGKDTCVRCLEEKYFAKKAL